MASLPEVLQKLVYMKTWFRLEKVTRKSCAGVDQNDATEAVIALDSRATAARQRTIHETLAAIDYCLL